MKRFLLSLGLWLGLSLAAQAQCVNVGGVNNVPQPGIVCANQNTVPTYFATGIGIVPGTAPTDVACLTGSATKTIRATRLEVSGTAGTAINIVTVVTKHASANTGGTAATGTALPVPSKMDSSFTAASATSTAYTANPTIVDSTPLLVSAKTLFLPVTSTGGSAGGVVWDWNGLTVSSPVLRGIAQQLCVNLNGVTAPSSGLMAISFQWTEQ